MTLDEAIRRNPYDPKQGNESAYCRYLRYNVDGWYLLDSKEVRRRWQEARNNMSNIELVIKIDEEIYQEAIKSGYSHLYDEEVANAVANGTPLPKGHGNLIDAKDLTPDADYEDGIFGAVSCQQIVEAEVIIEAESEG